MKMSKGYIVKIIILGDDGVGSTTLLSRGATPLLLALEGREKISGVGHYSKNIKIEGKNITLQIWAISTQERFSFLRSGYYRGSNGGLFIFDLTSYESFEHLPKWIEEVRSNVMSDTPLLLIGNKSDLTDSRLVSKEEIKKFAQNININYIETSAKTGENVEKVFEALTIQILKRLQLLK